ncbi:MAG: methylenetetrahydrofolate reductase C-terminal domain-containing protein [Chloroflexi bacterium]|nr:methylenetetrahydrofolate reductase C-terminal domain-containing protein [Chloroflexota bacterium]
MIVTEQKAFTEVNESLVGHQKIFVIGCGSCATAWHTGGEAEVKEMVEKLQGAGKTCIGWAISEETCDERKTRRELRAHSSELAEAEGVLVMSCGAGVQTTALVLEDKPVYPALNAMFLARLQRLTRADERCLLCGECILASTGGLCPVTLCPKELLNGPCGGYNHGMCEVNPDRECAWVSIYHRLQRIGQLDRLHLIQSPKDQSKRGHPRLVDKGAA